MSEEPTKAQQQNLLDLSNRLLSQWMSGYGLVAERGHTTEDGQEITVKIRRPKP